MSETALEIIKLIFSFLGSTVGTCVGFLSGVKLRDYRISQLEKKQSNIETKQESTEKEVADIRISISAIKEHDKAQDNKIDEHGQRIDVLESLHMKKE